MKPIRVLPLSFALVALLLASLACIREANLQPTTTVIAPTTAPAATSEPTKIPEPSSTPTPELGTLVLDEKFADNSNNWYVGKDKDEEVAIEDGQYKIRVLAQDNYFWFNGPVSIADLDITVDTKFTEGAPENAASGFLCHYKDVDNHYRLSISGDGFYAIQKWVDGDLSALANWAPASAIKQGNGAVNTIHAICAENHLTLYVNDTLLADVTDTSLSGGSFALMAARFANKKDDTKPVDVSFSNLVVRKPLAWALPTESLLSDSFDDNKNDWDVYKNDNASTQIEKGQMVINVTKPSSTYVVYPALSLSNVDISFDAVVLKGTPINTDFGADCRSVNTDNRYNFSVSGDGQYRLDKYVLGKVETVVNWTSSNAIKTGAGDVNHLRVVCNDDTLELYANDQLLISTQDTSLTAGGFSLAAGRFKEDDKPVSVGFDNVEVHYPKK